MKVRHRVLALLFLLSIVTYLDRVCISVAGPRMQKELALDPKLWGWVLGAFTLGYSLFEAPTGILGDRFGTRKTLTRIVIWWSAFTTLTGLVSSFRALIVTRFLFGAGEAGAYPNSTSTIGRWFPRAERARATGTVWMASRVGGALAPLLVVPIQQAYGWRASFWCFGILGVIWAAVWYIWFRDFPREKRSVGEHELAEIGKGSAAHTAPLPWRTALRDPNVWRLFAMYHTYCWGSHFYLSWLPTYLQKGRGFTESQMGVLSALPFVMGAITNGLGGWTSDALSSRYGVRFGRRAAGFSGLLLSAVFLFATALTPNRAFAVVFLVLGYGSMDFMLASSWAACLDIGGRYAGALSGAMNSMGQLGSFLSSVAFGYLVVHFGNYDKPMLVLATMLVISAMLFLTVNAAKPLIKE